jgi:hypothetical protein
VTQPAFTVILPHKRNPGNDAALRICLDMLMTNTVSDFALLMDAAEDAPLYPRINRMVQEARTQYCVITSSDIFMAPNWDVPMMAVINYERFVTNIVVEPGAIGVHPQNMHRDFGLTPSTFRRAEFEKWATGNTVPMIGGDGWVVPLMFPRDLWLSLGGLDLTMREFPYSAPDQKLLDDWKAKGGSIIRARSCAYHLQRWSDEGEQTHAKRRGK